MKRHLIFKGKYPVCCLCHGEVPKDEELVKFFIRYGHAYCIKCNKKNIKNNLNWCNEKL